MSPRSEEFMAMARDRLEAAEASLQAGFPSAAVTLAYSAMLHAARAALSEEDRYAKTHGGTWNLFGQVFVSGGRFDSVLFAEARETQSLREGSDYDALTFERDEAEAVVVLARRFIPAVESMLSD